MEWGFSRSGRAAASQLRTVVDGQVGYWYGSGWHPDL
jgi:hypothetical protein